MQFGQLDTHIWVILRYAEMECNAFYGEVVPYIKARKPFQAGFKVRYVPLRTQISAVR